MKNKQHRMLMAEMDKSLRKVTIVSGMAQRLTNKVAIVTGDHQTAHLPRRKSLILLFLAAGSLQRVVGT